MAASFLIVSYSHEEGLGFQSADSEAEGRRVYEERVDSGVEGDVALLRVEGQAVSVVDKTLVQKGARRRSVLDERIKAGLADPISNEERRLAASLRASYERKFGTQH